MRNFLKWMVGVQVAGLACVTAAAQLPNCPLRPIAGNVVVDAMSLTSQNGALSLALTERNAADSQGFMHYCFDYATANGDIESPTLRLNPGDTLTLDLTNQLNLVGPGVTGHSHMEGMAVSGSDSTDPCKSQIANLNTTNLHFHGLNVPPKCHQDDVINTLIQPSKTPFRYQIQIPANEPPGLYWYHPHVHGLTGPPIAGGATGAIIVGGIEKIKPQVAGLTERVLIVREQFPTGGGDELGAQLTLNYQPATYPLTAAAIIETKPGEKQFWRVLNSSTNNFLVLQMLVGTTAQSMELISLDGVPVTGDPTVTSITVPIAGRAEFIITGPPTGATATFVTGGFDTGPIGDSNPPQLLARVVATTSPVGASRQVEPGVLPAVTQRFAGLAAIKPTTTRVLYFAEEFSGTNDPPNFFITVDGQQPKLFKMNERPAITTKVGAVEDWTIQNRTGEMHAFHMHQIHFLVVAIDGVAVANPTVQDTIQVPYWSGKGPYHSVTLRMDFRDPNIAGTFMYHCHILDHEDNGMMAKIRVDP